LSPKSSSRYLPQTSSAASIDLETKNKQFPRSIARQPPYLSISNGRVAFPPRPKELLADTRQELIVITTPHSFAEPFITMFSNMLARAGLLAGVINAAVAATSTSSSSSSVPTISAVGSKFFFSNGTQYFVKGMPILCLSFEECG
jgi:hypothetical protein